MPLVVLCPNKHALQVADEHRNAIVQCPLCGVLLRIVAPPTPPAPAVPPAPVPFPLPPATEFVAPPAPAPEATPIAPPSPQPASELVLPTPLLEIGDHLPLESLSPLPEQDEWNEPERRSPRRWAVPSEEVIQLSLEESEPAAWESELELHHPLEESGADLAAPLALPAPDPTPLSLPHVELPPREAPRPLQHEPGAPLRVLCPNGHPLDIDEKFAGMGLSCPICEAEFRASAPLASIVTEPVGAPLSGAIPVYSGSEEDLSTVREAAERAAREGRRRAGRSLTLPERMERVNVGLRFHYGKCVGAVVSYTLRVLILLLAPLLIGKADALLGLLITLTFLVGLGSAVSGGIGSLLCCAGPRKSGLRELSIVTASLEGGAAILVLIGLILSLAKKEAGEVLLSLGLLAGLVAWIVFLVFLRRLAGYARDDRTATAIGLLMWMMLAVLVGGGIVLAMVKAALSGPALSVVGTIVLVAVTAGLIKCTLGILQALGAMRRQIAKRWLGGRLWSSKQFEGTSYSSLSADSREDE